MVQPLHLIEPPRPCSYIEGREAIQEFVFDPQLTAGHYANLLTRGWRRFGFMAFRPVCDGCNQCRSLRVPVATFSANRSQRRAARANSDLTLAIRKPRASREVLRLYDKYHLYRSETREWTYHGRDADDFSQAFVENPFPTEEWRYYLGDELVAVGYVDALPVGLSAIYFFYDPELAPRSLGTFNVLVLLGECARRKLPHLYLGYYVDECGSLSYKANFGPNELYDPASGEWRPFKA